MANAGKFLIEVVSLAEVATVNAYEAEVASIVGFGPNVGHKYEHPLYLHPFVLLISLEIIHHTSCASSHKMGEWRGNIIIC